jgi:hypothetical protein
MTILSIFSHIPNRMTTQSHQINLPTGCATDFLSMEHVTTTRNPVSKLSMITAFDITVFHKAQSLPFSPVSVDYERSVPSRHRQETPWKYASTDTGLATYVLLGGSVFTWEDSAGVFMGTVSVSPQSGYLRWHL